MPHDSEHAYPYAKRDDLVDAIHGYAVADPYRWLEDEANLGCEQWCAEQDRFYADTVRDWPEREWFRSQLRAIVDVAGNGTSTSPPVSRGGRQFFLRRSRSDPHPQLIVLSNAGTAQPKDEQVIVNPAELDANATISLDGWRPSWTGELIAYQVSRAGSEKPALWVHRVSDNAVVEGPLHPGRLTPVAWAVDDSGFCYVAGQVANGDTRSVRWHALGSDSEQDTILFETTTPQLSVKTSPDGRWIVFSASAGAASGNQLWLARTDPGRDPTQILSSGVEPVLVHDGTRCHAQAMIKFGPDGEIFLVTDQDAPYGMLAMLDPTRPDLRHTLIDEHPPDVVADVVSLIDPSTGAVQLLVSTTRHGVSFLTRYNIEGRIVNKIPLPGPGLVYGLTVTSDGVGRPQAWFGYTDFKTPHTMCQLPLVALPEMECS